MWVAREENGLLRLYTKKPYRYDGGIWRIPNDGDCITISDEEYPQYKSIKWEDEPIEIELVPKMMNAVQEKLAESVDDYFDYVGHVQDIHPYSKEQEQNYYNDMCWRWQDWNDIKYDHPSTWDLNFDDYVGSKR